MTADDFVITDTYLTDANGDRLPLRPRTISYGAGDADESGTYSVPIANDSDETVIVRNLRFRLVPRMIDPLSLSIEDGNNPLTTDGLIVNILEDIEIPGDIILEPNAVASFAIGNINDWYAARLGGGGGSGEDGSGDDPNYPPSDVYREMFPSTYIYGTATVIVANQQVWDPDSEQFVITDLETEVFFQLAGVPATVPEPTSAACMVLAIAAAILRRRNRFPTVSPRQNSLCQGRTCSNS